MAAVAAADAAATTATIAAAVHAADGKATSLILRAAESFGRPYFVRMACEVCFRGSFAAFRRFVSRELFSEVRVVAVSTRGAWRSCSVESLRSRLFPYACFVRPVSWGAGEVLPVTGEVGGTRGASRIVPFFSMSPFVPCVECRVAVSLGERIPVVRCFVVSLSAVPKGPKSGWPEVRTVGCVRKKGAAAERLRRDIGPGPVAGCRRESDRRRLFRKRKGRGTVAGLGWDAGGNFGKLPIFIAASPPGFRSRFASGTGGTVKWKRI